MAFALPAASNLRLEPPRRLRTIVLRPIPNLKETTSMSQIRPYAVSLLLVLAATPALAQAPIAEPAKAVAVTPTPTTGLAVTPAPDDANLYFIAPRAGARIRGAVVVQFGLRNMGVTQAGSTAAKAGHHHLLVDLKETLEPGDTIPASRQHLHFGGGQTETRLDLPPGRHTLQLVLGDATHRVFTPPVISKVVEITVLPPEKRRRGRRT